MGLFRNGLGETYIYLLVSGVVQHGWHSPVAVLLLLGTCTQKRLQTLVWSRSTLGMIVEEFSQS